MSKLSDEQKSKFIEYLIRELFQKNSDLFVDFDSCSRFIKERLSQYIHVIDYGKGRDQVARIIFHFLGYFGLGEDKDAALNFSLYTVASKSAIADVKFLNNISERFNLTS